MEEKRCPNCNSLLDGGESFCGICGKSIETKEIDVAAEEKNGKKRIFSIALVVFVFLGGVVLLFYSGLITNPLKDGGSAAIVNGEKIYWKDVEQKLEFYKKLYSVESQGNSSSSEVKAALEKVRQQILNSMIQEKVLLAEAKKEKIEVSKTEIAERVNLIKKEMSIPDKDFEGFLKSHSLSISEFEKRVEAEILINKLIEKGTKEKGVGAEEVVKQLIDSAAVKVFPREVSLISESGVNRPCCSSRGGGCGGGKKEAGKVDAKRENIIKTMALKEYGEKGEGLDVKIQDFGCHIQVDLYEKNKIAASYIYQDGKLRKI